MVVIRHHFGSNKKIVLKNSGRSLQTRINKSMNLFFYPPIRIFVTLLSNSLPVFPFKSRI